MTRLAARDGARYSDTLQMELGPERQIDPSLVVEGEPVYRAKLLHTTADRRYPAALWDCTRGKFRCYFEGDEVVYILQGRAIVHDDDGRVTRLGPGDTALFPKGSTNVWEVPHYVKKLSVHRLPGGARFGRLFRIVRLARGRFFATLSGLGRQPRIEWTPAPQRVHACH